METTGKPGDPTSPDASGKILLSTDLLSGLLFAAVGAAALYISWRYPAGTAARMGPGYFPHLVGGLLVLLGSVLAVRAWIRPGPAIAIIDVRPAIFVLAGTVSFGFLLERFGLVMASVVLIVASRLGRPDFKLLEVLLLAAVLVTGATLLFVYALGLSVRVFPAWAWSWTF